MKYKNQTIEGHHITGNIEYTIIYKKIKNTYIQIKDGIVIVKTPKHSTLNYIENIIKSKKEWITQKLIEQSKDKNEKKYHNGNIIKVLGKPYILKILYTLDKQNQIYIENEYIYCKLNNSLYKNDEQIYIKKLIDKYYKYIATQEIPAVMEDLKQRTGFAPIECSIKNLKATWGICSSNQKITINQNLMAYSRHTIEYVCLHEICHLKYMNHSKNFWNMVEHYMPDYKLAKKELKE